MPIHNSVITLSIEKTEEPEFVIKAPEVEPSHQNDQPQEFEMAASNEDGNDLSFG